jgi:hypothetical protein
MFPPCCPYRQPSSRSHQELHSIVNCGADTGQSKVFDFHGTFIQHRLGIEVIAFHDFPVLVSCVMELFPVNERMFDFGLEKVFCVPTPYSEQLVHVEFHIQLGQCLGDHIDSA